jgi:hypothetical protein
MKATVYLRVAVDKQARNMRGRQPRFAATQRPTVEPIYTTDHHRALPTVAFALALDLPDSMFERASEVIAELNISEDDAQIAATVVDRG